MEPADIVDELEAIGLEEDEAWVYLRLLQAGPAKVSDLVDRVELSRSSLYRVLDDLVEEGVVAKSLARPTVYTPEEPETVFDRVTEALEQRLDQLGRVRGRVLGPLEELAGDGGSGTEGHHWKRIEGAARIYEVIAKRAREADERIDVVSNHGLCRRRELPEVEKAWRVLAERGGEGVAVHLLLGFEDPAESVPDEVLARSEELRSFEGDETVHFLLFDREELVLVLRPQAGDVGSDEMAVWTNAPGILATHEALVESLWPQAALLG